MIPALALSLALQAAATKGQDPPPFRPKVPLTFAAEARTVNLTVTVRGVDGKLVRDLTANDFTVFEDEKPQDIRFFARVFDPSRADDEGQEGAPDPTAIDLGMLFDTSSSMEEVLKLSQNAASSFLESIPRARALTTVFFDSDIRLSKYNSESQQGLFDRIQKAKSSGETLLRDAIAVYLSRISDDPGRKIVVLFTDGEDTRSLISASELKDLVRSSTVTIYPIVFGGKYSNSASALQARGFMRELADLSGGDVFNPRTFKDLQPIYDGLLDEFAAQYVIGYIPQGDAVPGDHRLRVEVNRSGAKARHRRGYHVATPEKAGTKK
jgi:Ca-activated chloride channel family protein